MTHLARGLFALITLASTSVLRAAEPRALLGAHVACDVVVASRLAAGCPAGEVFGRLFVSAPVAIEISAGYRHFTLDNYGGRYSSSYTLTQYPLLVGASYVVAPGASLRPFLGAGFMLALSKSSFSSYLYPGPAISSSNSSVVLGAFAKAGLQVALGRTLALDSDVRYVFNPVPSNSGAPTAQHYASGQLGLAATF